MTYFFIGPPLSGKGTQAELLADTLKIPYISIGAVLRKSCEANPALCELVDQGELLPEASVQKLFSSIHETYPDNVIVDGAFRTVPQVAMIAQLWDLAQSVVIWIELSDDQVRARAKHRISEIGKRRKDDDEAALEKRIALYRSAIDGVASALEQRRVKIIRINGGQSIEAIAQAIEEQVERISKQLRNER